jgi:hypothetical protein
VPNVSVIASHEQAPLQTTCGQTDRGKIEVLHLFRPQIRIPGHQPTIPTHGEPPLTDSEQRFHSAGMPFCRLRKTTRNIKSR